MHAKQIPFLVSMLVLLLQAGCAPSMGACPAPSMDTELLTDSEAGYCLLYPTKYSTEVPGYIVINPVDAAGDVLGDAWMSIEVESAAGRTAAQVADEQIAAAGQGFTITRSQEKVGGEPAEVIDGLPGPDPWRKVFVVHGERLYTLTFLPWAPSGGGAGQQAALEGLYAMVIDSLRFLPVEGN